jgi:RNA polymerase sigma-70 factor (ECF subfamily)
MPWLASSRVPPEGHRPLRAAADAELVARVMSGDRDAEEAMYRSHVQYVAGIVLRLMAHPAEAEDIVQDTFVIALSQISSLRDPAALRAWLARIAVSQVRRRFRRRRLLRLLGFEPDPDAPGIDAIATRDAGPMERSQLYAIGRVLDTLPTGQRIAWCLRFVEGATLEEVAQACDCSLATAKRRIAAAHERVRIAVDFGDVAVPLAHTSVPASPEAKA